MIRKFYTMKKSIRSFNILRLKHLQLNINNGIVKENLYIFSINCRQILKIFHPSRNYPNSKTNRNEKLHSIRLLRHKSSISNASLKYSNSVEPFN